jgi:hypothetical protein
MQPSEKGLQSQIVAYCLARGVGVIRLNSISRGFVRGYYWWDLTGKKRSAGASDLIVFKNFNSAFLELKRSTKAKSNSTTEAAQYEFRLWCQHYGVNVYRVDSFEAGKEIIDGLADEF